MKDLNPEIIRNVLKIYEPNWRFLKSARLEDSNYFGRFELSEQCPYLLPSSKGFSHATEIELDNCVSQLCYASIADMMSKNKIPGFEDYDFSELQENGVLTIDSQKRFRKIIPRSKFDGQIKLDEVRIDGDLSILRYTGDFNNKSMILSPFDIVLKKL